MSSQDNYTHSSLVFSIKSLYNNVVLINLISKNWYLPITVISIWLIADIHTQMLNIPSVNCLQDILFKKCIQMNQSIFLNSGTLYTEDNQ